MNKQKPEDVIKEKKGTKTETAPKMKKKYLQGLLQIYRKEVCKFGMWLNGKGNHVCWLLYEK